ncbi:MAG: D-alanyl-D-alanine carboxypeptidase family protein [Acutalibacteraceae bacterium]
MKIKKLICLITVIVLTFLTLTVTATANFNDATDVGTLRSYAYYMISLDDGSEMFSKNENKKLAPAAFNKIVAAVVAIEQWGNLEDKITVTEQSLSLVEYNYGIRTANLMPGDVYTKRQLLDCLIIYSANDVASVIAYNISKTKAAYEQQMQALVDKIGCKNTKIVDMLGFDTDGQYTTAKDVAAIIKYALGYPAFSEAFSQNSVTMPKTGENEERVYQGSNKMANATISDYYHSSVTGGKQTSTDEAGECIAVTTSKDGYSYLVVVMKGKLVDIDSDNVNENTCMTDAKALLTWVYNNVRFKVVASPGQIVDCVDISAGRGTDTLKLTPEKEVSVLAVSKVSSYSVLIEPIAETVPEKIRAPKKAGDIICQAKVLYANKELTTINLVAAEDVNLSLTGFIISAVSSVLMSKFFIAFEIIALILLLCYLAVKIYNIKSDKKVSLHIVSQGKKQKDEDGQAKKASPNKKKGTQKTSPAKTKNSAVRKNPVSQSDKGSVKKRK